MLILMAFGNPVHAQSVTRGVERERLALEIASLHYGVLKNLLIQ
jgi:hypothetical protein